MAATENPYVDKYPCPSDAFAIVTVASEVKMSHWIMTTTLESAASEQLLDFGSSWSSDQVTWTDATHVRLQMRRYPGDRSMTAVLDCAARTITIETESPAQHQGQTLSFGEFVRSGMI